MKKKKPITTAKWVNVDETSELTERDTVKPNRRVTATALGNLVIFGNIVECPARRAPPTPRRGKTEDIIDNGEFDPSCSRDERILCDWTEECGGMLQLNRHHSFYAYFKDGKNPRVYPLLRKIYDYLNAYAKSVVASTEKISSVDISEVCIEIPYNPSKHDYILNATIKAAIDNQHGPVRRWIEELGNTRNKYANELASNQD